MDLRSAKIFVREVRDLYRREFPTKQLPPVDEILDELDAMLQRGEVHCVDGHIEPTPKGIEEMKTRRLKFSNRQN